MSTGDIGRDRDGGGEKKAEADAMAASMGGPSVLSRFALPSNHTELMVGVKKRVSVVQVAKPKRTWWWITRPEYVLEAALLYDENSTAKESYLVAPELIDQLGDDVVRTSLHGALTRQGQFLIVPVRLPGVDGRLDPWNTSMREAIAVAAGQPVRTASNREAGAYDLFTTATDITFPSWPDEPWSDLVAIAFRDKIIEDEDHPVLRRLRGEV